MKGTPQKIKRTAKDGQAAPATSNFKEIDFDARAKRELAKIAKALNAIPAASKPFRRMAQSEEIFPYHDIASSVHVPNLILDLIKGRDPNNQWIAVERALEGVDDAGNGQNMFMAMYREAAFQIGVEYALRSLPGWCSLLGLIAPDRLEVIGQVVRRIAKNSLLDGRDGE